MALLGWNIVFLQTFYFPSVIYTITPSRNKHFTMSRDFKSPWIPQLDEIKQKALERGVPAEDIENFHNVCRDWAVARLPMAPKNAQEYLTELFMHNSLRECKHLITSI